jgi:SAM-dependent methyltransferase
MGEQAILDWYERYQHRFYASRPGWIDGTTEFHELIETSIAACSKPRVLELGPGPRGIGVTTRFLRGRFGEIDGLDIDPEIRTNPDLRQAFVYDGTRWPLADESYDLIAADFVLEHVSNPDELMAEVKRVLAPGGVFVFRTPNLYHYVSVVSRLTPHWFHTAVARRLKGHPETVHEYPTFYRANTAGSLRACAARTGLDVLTLRRIEKGPSYARPSRVLYLTFMLYERLVNSTELLAWARVAILGALRKPSRKLPT